MKSTEEDFVRTQATQWFRTLERHLGEMSRLETRTRLAMASLEAEFKATETRSSQTFHVKRREGNPLPDAIHRVRICGTPGHSEEPGPPSAKPSRHWVQHLPGRPTRDELYFQVKDVGLLELFTSFYDRATALNGARHVLVMGRVSIAQRAKALADPRAWEGGELSIPAPLLEASDLPDTGVRALGAAWRLMLRTAAVQFELLALAERHNASPPWRGLRLAFRVDGEHPFGRFIWSHRGEPLSRLPRDLTGGKLHKRIDGASLPDRVMRLIRIPTPVRKAITRHERHRRRMARIYGKYVDALGLLLSTGPERLKEALKLLGEAGFPGSEAIPPVSGSAYLNN